MAQKLLRKTNITHMRPTPATFSGWLGSHQICVDAVAGALGPDGGWRVDDAAVKPGARAQGGLSGTAGACGHKVALVRQVFENVFVGVGARQAQAQSVCAAVRILQRSVFHARQAAKTPADVLGAQKEQMALQLLFVPKIVQELLGPEQAHARPREKSNREAALFQVPLLSSNISRCLQNARAHECGTLKKKRIPPPSHLLRDSPWL